MIVSINCPECNSNLKIQIENNKVILVSINDVVERSELKIAETLRVHNIEFG